MNITVRRWTTNDTESVRRILQETWLDAYSSFVPIEDLLSYLDQLYNVDLIKKSVIDPNIVGFIAEVDGTVAGCERTHFNREEQRLYVQQLYILPKYQRLGLGKRLMEIAADRAKSLGLDRVWLGVMVKNESAVVWYKEMGYEIMETSPFTMGKTIVEHHIGYVPIDRVLSSVRQQTLDNPLLSQKTYTTFKGTSFQGELAQSCRNLIEQQKTVWPQMAEGYRAFEFLKIREIICQGFNAYVQFNPERLVSTQANTDPVVIRERPCFLCLENLQEPQKGILYHNEFLILCNPAPIFAQHFTISNIHHVPQELEPSLGAMFDLARDLSPAFTVFYNGPKCGASSPDHLHFQASPRLKIPVERDAVDVRRRNKVYYRNHVAGFTLMDYGRTVVIIESTDKELMSEFMQKIMLEWEKLFHLSEEPMMNVLCSYQEQIWRLIIFPRRKHRPDVFFEEGDRRVLISPAAVDIGGLLVTPLEKDFLCVDARLVESIFEEVSIKQRIIEDFIRDLS